MIKFVLVFLSCSLAICCAYNEGPCRAQGGYCLTVNSSPACPNNRFVSGLCPTQPFNVKCCLTYPYQESACSSIGGTCKEVSQCSGTSVSGKCPTQGNDIKCCLGFSGPGNI